MPCPHCSRDHGPDSIFCPATGKAISVSQIDAGATIDGKYRVVRRVASGGMGAVYEVVHERIRRRLAMKLILPELATNQEVIQRFELEARAASAIGHENIVEITDMGTTTDGLPFLVMEFLEGHDLSTLLEEGRSIPVPRAKHILAQILSALGAAHAQQIIHRDLKPENVFLIRRAEDPDFVKLLDFGISKIAGGDEAKLHLTSTGLILGTPYYMSPEQARGDKQLDHRSDLFAAGTMLYQMLTGRRPFAGENLNQLLYQILRGEITPPRQMNPEIPVALERVLVKALAIEPDQRFQDAETFRAALLGKRQVETSELPPVRASITPMAIPDAFSPTLMESGPGSAPVPPGTPMAWTGSSTVKTRRSRLALGLGIGVGALVVGVVAALLFGLIGQGSTPRRAPSQSGAITPEPSGPAMEGATVTALPNSMSDARASSDAPPVPVQPELVRLDLKVEPPAAAVELDGRLVAKLPIILPRTEKEHRLTVGAPGHEPETLTVHARSDQTLVIRLKVRPRVGRPGMTTTGMKPIKAFDGSDI